MKEVTKERIRYYHLLITIGTTLAGGGVIGLATILSSMNSVNSKMTVSYFFIGIMIILIFCSGIMAISHIVKLNYIISSQEN